MEGGSSIHVSDVVNFVVGDSWLQSPEMASSRRDDVDILPIFKGGSLDHFKGSDEGNILYKREGLASSAFESNVDLIGMRILSSIFKPSLSTSHPVSRDSILNVKGRLAQVRPVAVSEDGSTLTENLATELVNLSSCDKWLLNRIQTHEFDGTWVSIICGLYQSLYLYRTEIVEAHFLSCALRHSARLSDIVLPKAKVMVLLLRWQHLQNFQRLVTERLLEKSRANEHIYQIIRKVGTRDFLVESLITSLHRTAIQMDTWAIDQSSISFIIRQKAYKELEEFIKAERMESTEAIESQLERQIPLMKFFLANIFWLMLFQSDFDPENMARAPEKMVSGIEDDKWLWQYLHGLKEASNLGNWSAIICALYQGQFLHYHMDLLNDIKGREDKSHKMEEGRLTILLFRSIHLQNFERKLKENRSSILLKIGELHLEERDLEHLERSVNMVRRSEREDAHRQQGHYDFIRRRTHAWRLLEGISQGSIMATENFIRSCLKEGSRLHSLDCDHPQTEASHNDNVYLGSSCLPNGIKVEECLDLKLVYDLGGLICTIEGDPSSNEGNGCISWCIIRHNTLNLCFCMDLKKDEYRNKEHILDGTMDVDYEGVVEVATKDGNTTVKSLELDGSYFDGCIEDFADRRGGKTLTKSCAAKALHTLTSSPFLDSFKLKCSVLYMIAMAFLVGKKDHLILKWKGAAGHIEHQPPSKDSLDQSQGQSNRGLQKCTLLYTSSGTRFLGQDIIWEGDNGSNLSEEAGGNMKVKTPADTDKVRMISGHQSLWNYHRCLSGDFLADDIEAILAKTQEAMKRKRVQVDEIAALGANKQNSGGGFGICGGKVEAHHEYRSRLAETILQRGERGIEDAHVYENTTVSGHLSLFIKDLRSLQVELENGTIGQNDQEVFVVRRDGSRCLQIFACNERPWPGYENSTYYDFTWITDVIASTEGVAKRIMKDSLKGKQMTICRSSSTLKKKPEIDEFQTSGANLLIQKFKQKLQTLENVVVRDETMLQQSKITWTKPRDSNDGWKFIIGNQKGYSQGNYFFKATELQAVVCSATRYITGGATLRTEIQGTSGSDQPSTSSNLIASSGSCRELCETSEFLVKEREVMATGRFSTCKAQDNRLKKNFYWG